MRTSSSRSWAFFSSRPRVGGEHPAARIDGAAMDTQLLAFQS